MKCAVQLVFSDRDQEKFNKLRSFLSEKGVPDEAVPINHVTLADIEIDEKQISMLDKFLNNYANNHKKIKLNIAISGSFMTDENVLFVAPVMTEVLMKDNDDMIEGLNSLGIESARYYVKDNWQPHCTLAIRLSDEELLKGFKLVKESGFLPIEVEVDQIDLLRYNPKPFCEILKYELLCE